MVRLKCSLLWWTWVITHQTKTLPILWLWPGAPPTTRRPRDWRGGTSSSPGPAAAQCRARWGRCPRAAPVTCAPEIWCVITMCWVSPAPDKCAHRSWPWRPWWPGPRPSSAGRWRCSSHCPPGYEAGPGKNGWWWPQGRSRWRYRGSPKQRIRRFCETRLFTWLTKSGHSSIDWYDVPDGLAT